MKRRGFFARAFGGVVAAVVGPKVLAEASPNAPSFPASPGFGLRGLTDDGTYAGILYSDRMWFTSREGVHVYMSEVHKP